MLDYIGPLREAGSKVSIFLAADKEQIDAALDVGATTVELHTGLFCDLHNDHILKEKEEEFQRLRQMANYAHSKGLEVHAGHGLTLDTVAQISSITEVEELNIGHSLISDSIFTGLKIAIRDMRTKMEEGRKSNKNFVLVE